MNVIPMPAVAVTETDVPALAVTVQHLAETIPLSRLVPSKANVRRMNALVGISELADSIEAHGLIQNLTVRKAKKDKQIRGCRRCPASRGAAPAGEGGASGRGCQNPLQGAGH